MTDDILKAIAHKIDGIEYPARGIRELDLPKGVVVAYGMSDDLLEFEGAISDEVGAFNGATVYISEGKIVSAAVCPECGRTFGNVICVSANWNDTPGNGEPCWTVHVNVPSHPFTIMENGEAFCKGVVFSTENVYGKSTVCELYAKWRNNEGM